MENYKFVPDEIAAVGDQLLTDVYGANRLGITSILVNQMGAKDFFNSFDTYLWILRTKKIKETKEKILLPIIINTMDMYFSNKIIL